MYSCFQKAFFLIIFSNCFLKTGFYIFKIQKQKNKLDNQKTKKLFFVNMMFFINRVLFYKTSFNYFLKIVLENNYTYMKILFLKYI